MERTKTLFSQKLISQQEQEAVRSIFSDCVKPGRAGNCETYYQPRMSFPKTRLTAPKYGIVTSITKEEGEMAVGGMFNPGVLMTLLI